MRKCVCLNDHWTLKMGEKEETVSLPHCFNAADGQSGNRPMFRGVVTYEKDIRIDEVPLFAYLEIGAASNASVVSVNGKKVGESNLGFSLKRYDVTSFFKKGQNHIAISVSNAPDKNIYPLMADFSFYGGIYRDVNLLFHDSAHFDEVDGSRDGIKLIPSIKGRIGQLKVEANVVCKSASEIALSIQVDGKKENTPFVLISERGRIEWEMTLPNLRRWDGVRDPYLYEVQVSLLGKNGDVLDCRVLKIGFRDIRFDAERGLLLNGSPCPIKGVARHQDFAGLGNAITQKEMRLDLALIREMGANAVRLSHYQHADDFYSLCDEAGLLVYAEIPVISAVIPSEAAETNALEHLHALIQQTTNHPSVFCYGVQNEVCMVSKNDYAFRLVDRLAKKAKEWDPTRITAQANEYTTEDDCPILRSTDVLGFNLYYGWYYGEMEDLGPRLDSIMAKNPSKMILLTEYGVDTNPLCHSDDPHANDYSEEYQVQFVLNALKAMEKRPSLAGGFAWAMFDFGSSARDEGGKKGLNQKGLVTMDRKMKKDAFYLYKAFWSDEKFLHIASKRYKNRAAEKVAISVISNLPEVSLYVNGRLVERQQGKERIFTFQDVALQHGENEVVAKSRGYVDSFILRRVEQKDDSYVLPKKKDDARSTAINWFENVDLESLTGLDKPLREEGFTLNDSILEIGETPAAKAVFMKHFAPLTESSRFSWDSPISVRRLLGFAKIELPPNVEKAIDAELNAIDKSSKGK